MGGECGTYLRQERFWWVNLRERDHLEEPAVDWKIILKCFFKKCDGAYTGLIWLRIGTGCVYL
jgi:hypothetical protein